MSIAFVGEPFHWLPPRAAVESRPYIIKTKNYDHCKAVAETLH